MSQENLSQHHHQQQQQQQLPNNTKLTTNSIYALPITTNTTTTTTNTPNTNLLTKTNDPVQTKPPDDLIANSQEQLAKLQETVTNTTNHVTNTTNVYSSSSVTSSMTKNETATTTNPNSTSSIYKKIVNNTSDAETEEENDILEESPDGRWIKRNETLTHCDVPGIDEAYLAMDTEYGIEVAWNEIFLSDGKKFKNKEDEDKIDRVFENLINLNHPNIVKFHKHWRDKNKEQKLRIVFITEYMSSGSLKSFLRKAKRTNQPIKKQTWKRWCIQLLTALHYLHNCEPSIIHGNLSCDTILIQHNGLIKIGSIAPDIVNQHVKTVYNQSWSKNLHFIAPELYDIYPLSTNEQSTNNLLQPTTHTHHSKNSSSAVDIYAFGMVALEMFNLDLGGNGDTHIVTPELIKQSIECLDEKQRDFINCCLQTNPKDRPTAKELLFHPLLFEVPSLRLLAAHQIIQHQNEARESCDSDFRRDPNFVIASTNPNFFKQLNSQRQEQQLNDTQSSSPTPLSSNSNQASNQTSTKYYDFKYSELSQFEVNKFLEDVKNGVYPLTAFGLNQFSSVNNTNNKHKHSLSDQLDSARSFLSVNNEMNSLIRPPISPSNTSVSGTSTSVANTSNNFSSQTSSSSTSPTQSLTSQVNVHHQQQLLVDSNITHNHNDLQLESDKNMNSIDNELINSSIIHSNTPTPILQQQQQLVQQFVNTDNNNKVLYSSPSASPPPPHIPLNLQPIAQHVPPVTSSTTTTATNSASISRTQSPITTLTSNSSITTTNLNGTTTTTNNNNNLLPSSLTAQSSPTPFQQQNYTTSSNLNNKLGETQLNETNAFIYVEKRHVEKMEINIKAIDKYTYYKLTLNITFDDKTSRFLDTNINNSDTAAKLTDELVSFGLVSENDREHLTTKIQEELARSTMRDFLETEQNNYYLNK